MRQITAVHKITLQQDRGSCFIRPPPSDNIRFLKRATSDCERPPLKNRRWEGNKIHCLLRLYLAAQPNRHSFWKRGPKLPCFSLCPPRSPRRALSDDGVRLTRGSHFGRRNGVGTRADRQGGVLQTLQIATELATQLEVQSV